MSGFYDAIDDYLDSTAESDRQMDIIDAIYVEIDGFPAWRWAGVEGTLITPDGERWAGWYYEGQPYISPPKLTDIRDGNSPLYEQVLGFVDEESYLNLRDNKDAIKGKLLIYYSILMTNKSLRSESMPGDAWRLRMVAAKFTEITQKDDDGGHKKMFRVSVLAKNANAGRSRTFFGTMTETGQKARSERLFGITGDVYGQFLIKYAGGYTINLDA